MLCTIVQPSLNRRCHLKTRLLETPLNLSVHFSFLCLLRSYLYAHKTGLPLGLLSPSLTSPFSLGCYFNGQYSNMCYLQINSIWLWKSSVMTSRNIAISRQYIFMLMISMPLLDNGSHSIYKVYI